MTARGGTRIAYYSSGSIGAGHAVHGLALRAALERAAVPCRFRVLLAAGAVSAAGASNDVVTLPDERAALRDPERARRTELARELASFQPDVLLVDLAWIDLRYLLPLPDCEAWLLLRWIPKQFIRGPFNRSFRQEQYARVVATEPIVPVETTDWVEPVVICNPDECRPPGALRRRWSVAPGRSLTLVVQAGLPGEREALIAEERARAGDALVVGAGPDDPDALFPIAPWLPGADRIVGGAGYNLYWEIRWLELDARARLVAFRRRIDDQTPRVRLAAGYRMRENGADQLAAWLR